MGSPYDALCRDGAFNEARLSLARRAGDKILPTACDIVSYHGARLRIVDLQC